MGKVKDQKSIGHCGLCMMYHAKPNLEWVCYNNKYPRFKTKPVVSKETTNDQQNV